MFNDWFDVFLEILFGILLIFIVVSGLIILLLVCLWRNLCFVMELFFEM